MNTALSYLVAAQRSEMRELETLARTCNLVLAASKLVHCLQHERGASNIYLASSGKRWEVLRLERLANTDSAQAAVRDWLVQTNTADDAGGRARLYTRIAIAWLALDELPRIRAEVSELTCSLAEVLECYTRIIGALLALVFEAADVALDPDISRLLIALFHLMQGKEFAGQERGTGAAAFAMGRIDSSEVRSIEHLIDMQEQCFQRFEEFGGDLRSEWRALHSLLPLSDLERMRRKLITSAYRELDSILVDAWFECCTRRMDELHRVENHLATLVQQLCQEKLVEKSAQMQDQEAILAGFKDAPSPLVAFSAQVGPAGDVPMAGSGGGVGPHLTQALMDMLQAQSVRLQSLTEELVTVRATLDERKIIERAKGLLMAHQGLTEEGAYRLLRQNAMNRNSRLVDVAKAVLSVAEILPSGK